MIDHPLCGLCGTTINDFEIDTNEENGDRVYTMRCHGEELKVVYTIMDTVRLEIAELGRPFTQRDTTNDFQETFYRDV
jgi:hypothetical protein